MGQNHVEIWNSFLEIIKDNISTQAFKTWFIPIKPIKFKDNTLTIQVPTSFYYEWIEEHYVTLLRKCIHRVIDKDAKLEYIILIDNSSANKAKTQTVLSNNVETKSHDQTLGIPTNLNADIENPFVIPGLKKVNIHSQLSPKYTFDNFIEGECNKFAKNAGLSITSNLSKTSFNPLFIYSEMGLGKTHLLHAIGNQIKTLHPDKKVLYITSEQFTQQFVNALQKKIFSDFLNLYQSLDVFIIDDIHNLAGKTKTQDIFFQIFNYLHQNNKQLIITCDKPIKDVQGVENRIISRLKWGLTADLQRPDYETRKEILINKAKQDSIEIADEVIEYLARYVDTNVRELEGALVSLLAKATYNKQEINIDLAKKIVSTIVKHTQKEINLKYIEAVVCNYFDMTSEKIKSSSRKRKVVEARQISMYFSRELTKNSLKNIGSFFDRDHATVIYSCESVKDLIATDPKFRNDVEEIEKRIKVSHVY